MDPQTPLLSDPDPQEPVNLQVAEAAGAPPPKRNSFVMSFIPKKDLTKFLPLVLILFLVASLPLVVFLVKQRQAPERAEVSPGQVTDRCGHVTLGPPNEDYNPQTSTYTLRVPIKNNRSSSLGRVKLRWETFYCQNGNQQNCDQNRQTFEEEINLSPNEQRVLQRSVKQELGNDCGSLQIDVGVLSVNGDTSCTTLGKWETAVWGVHNTGRDCVGIPTPPPGTHPDCRRLEGPSSATPGEIITFKAYPVGANLDRVEFWLMSEVDKNKHGFCPPSEWAPKVWTLIDKDIDGSNGWSAQWNTTGYSEGKYFIAANVYSTYGGENWWCTGNPEGPCNQDPKGKSCPLCSKWVTLTTQVPTSTPTPSLTPIPTAPPDEYSCLCDRVTADKDLNNLNVGDVVNFTGVGRTSHPSRSDSPFHISKIKFAVSKSGTVVKAQEVPAAFDREEGDWRFYKGELSYTIEDYGDYEVAIQVACPQGWQD